jgi:hypothetical protein
MPLLQSAGALGIMCAYNAVNGTASCASAPLLKKLLRDNMGFDGYVVSDWCALRCLWQSIAKSCIVYLLPSSVNTLSNIKWWGQHSVARCMCPGCSTVS